MRNTFTLGCIDTRTVEEFVRQDRMMSEEEVRAEEEEDLEVIFQGQGLIEYIFRAPRQIVKTEEGEQKKDPEPANIDKDDEKKKEEEKEDDETEEETENDSRRADEKEKNEEKKNGEVVRIRPKTHEEMTDEIRSMAEILQKWIVEMKQTYGYERMEEVTKMMDITRDLCDRDKRSKPSSRLTRRPTDERHRQSRSDRPNEPSERREDRRQNEERRRESPRRGEKRRADGHATHGDPKRRR